MIRKAGTRPLSARARTTIRAITLEKPERATPMTDTIKITWRVDDGYAGGDRPHSTVIRVNEFDAEDSDDEIGEAIADIVQQDFETSITLSLKTTDVEAAIAAIRAQLKSSN